MPSTVWTSISPMPIQGCFLFALVSIYSSLWSMSTTVCSQAVSTKLIMQYKQKLNACYALTDLGPVHWLLGIKITCNRATHTISLSQSTFIDSIISCFSLSNAKPSRSPMIPGTTYTKQDAPSTPEETLCMQCTPYRQAIGSLMYIAITTHSDITFTVAILSRFLSNLGDAHWDAVKCIF